MVYCLQGRLVVLAAEFPFLTLNTKASAPYMRRCVIAPLSAQRSKVQRELERYRRRMYTRFRFLRLVALSKRAAQVDTQAPDVPALKRGTS